MNHGVVVKKMRATENRAQAHRMFERGTPIEVIARQMDTHTECIRRWLAQPKPDWQEPPLEDLTWQEEAVCREIDPDLWFPEQDGSPNEAQRICNTLCNVREQCLSYALRHHEEFGVWGGTNANERRRIWRRAA